MSEEKLVISLEVEDKPGVLSRLSTLFSRRGFNVESLTVGHTHKPGISRFTIVVKGERSIFEQIRKQSQKLIHVLTTSELTPDTSVMREFTIIKLDYNEQDAPGITHLLDFYGGRMLDLSEEVIIVEFSGSEEKIDQIFAALQEFTVLESIRTGKQGIKKGR